MSHNVIFTKSFKNTIRNPHLSKKKNNHRNQRKYMNSDIKSDSRYLPQKEKFTSTQAMITTSLFKILLSDWQIYFFSLNYKRHANFRKNS